MISNILIIRELLITSFYTLPVVGDAFVIEDTTNVKFPREIAVPGYTEPLVILGTGTFSCPFPYGIKSA
jgi:hypothetical protein